MKPLRIATFEADITPPIGSPLCGGWIRPAEGASDPLRALGVVLDWDDDPVVLCALDWCELRNGGHEMFREALAEAVSISSPDRVAVQCVHQHNAPFVDPLAQTLIAPQEGVPDLMDGAAFQAAMRVVADVARASLSRLRPVTQVRAGQAPVREVASNRRVPGPDGAIRTRWSACKDASLRAEPEGLIDPLLTSLSFWGEGEKLAVLHYYATHPMSHYGDGIVTADFMGLARQRRTEEDGGTPHNVFTGCAGNITAGKYNDGSPEDRAVLTDHIYDAMMRSERDAADIGSFQPAWRTCEVRFQPRTNPSGEALQNTLVDRDRTPVERSVAALEIAYREWSESHPAMLSCLSLGEAVRVIHLPGEPFVEFQLYAQSLRPDGIVVATGYGDGGIGYLPLERSFGEGGYEPGCAFAEPASEYLMKRAIQTLLE